MTLHSIPPGLWCVPSAIVALTGADPESVVHPALNRHMRHGGLLDLVTGASLAAAESTLVELGCRVRRYRRDGASGELRAHVATWARRSLRWPAPVLLFTSTHALVVSDGRVYDNHQPHGCPGAEHPYAKTTVTWAALVQRV